MRRLLAALLLGPMLLVPRVNAEDAPARPACARIRSHRITARLDLSDHRVVATDVLEFDIAGGRAVRLLDPGRVLTSSLPLTSFETGVSMATLPAGVDHLELAYVRRIDAGPSTRDGVISDRQVFLTGANGWYPRDAEGPPRLARFDVTTYVREPFLVVTQGRAPERTRLLAEPGWSSGTEVVPPTAKGGAPSVAYAVSAVIAQMPTDGLSLVAGPYRVSSRVIEGIEASTYLLEPDASAAPRWLDAVGGAITRYESVLGTYPHPKFDVVEGDPEAEFVAPSFTVLGGDRLSAPDGALRPPGARAWTGFIDRIYVRGWFGSGLFEEPSGGTWSSALLNYLWRFLARELESPEAGRNERRAALGSTVRSRSDPGQEPDRLAQDERGALVFHALRLRLGDGAFFARLKRLAADRVGTFVAWTDVLAALDGEWARPLVERRDLPTLRIVAASRWPGPMRSLNSDVRVEVVAEVAAGTAPWPPIDVPLAIDGLVVGAVTVTDGAGVFTGNVHGLPKAVELDPGFDVLRAIASPTDARRDLADGGRAALDVLETLRVLGKTDAASWREPERYLTTRLDALLGAKTDPAPAPAPASASAAEPGVADLTSSRDLTITTASGTVVLKDAFRPICTSPPRAKGTPLEFGEGDNPVPLPGRIPDTSIEGLERFWTQIERGAAPALLLLPNPEARKALASLVDAPNALTADAEAELAAPGPDGAARPRPSLGPWIAARRAKAFPGLRPLRVPVLLITDEAYEKIFELKDVRTIEFEVSFAPAKQKDAAGSAPTALVATWMPRGLPAERPPVVIVSARIGGSGQGDDASTGVACVLGALDEWEQTATDAKRGLVVCLFEGKFSSDATRSLATDLSKRYDVRALIDVGPVGLLRNDEVSVSALGRDAELRPLAVESIEATGLRAAAFEPVNAVLSDEPACFVEAGLRRVVSLRASPRPASFREMAQRALREPVIDPTGVARVSVAVRELLRRLLTAP